MIDITDPEFYLQKSLHQIRLEQNQRTCDSNPSSDILESSSLLSRVSKNTTSIFQGICVGSLAGISLSTVYFLRYKRNHPQIIQLILSNGVHLGLLGGQFVCFRELANKFSIENFRLPGLNLPEPLYDLSNDTKEIVKSSFAGFCSGFILSKLSVFGTIVQKLNNTAGTSVTSAAVDRPRNITDFIRRGNSFGLRVGIVWAVGSGIIQTSLNYLNQIRINWIVDEKVRFIYENYDKFDLPSDVNTALIDLPPPDQVLNPTLFEILSNPMKLDWFRNLFVAVLDYLPLVHSEEQYQYRQQLVHELEQLQLKYSTLSKQAASQRSSTAVEELSKE